MPAEAGGEVTVLSGGGRATVVRSGVLLATLSPGTCDQACGSLERGPAVRPVQGTQAPQFMHLRCLGTGRRVLSPLLHSGKVGLLMRR